MSRLDLVIFGATGFTGKHAVMECARIAKKKAGLTWGIAGRSQSKLNAVLEEASKKTGKSFPCSNVENVFEDILDLTGCFQYVIQFSKNRFVVFEMQKFFLIIICKCFFYVKSQVVS